MSKPFPVPNSTVSFWLTEPDRLADYRSTEELPATSDVVIIGSGISGTSVAYHLQQESKTKSAVPSVTILEAREACSGATGRNGGHMRPTPITPLFRHTSKYGLELAMEVARFEAAHVPAIKQVIERERIDCDFILTRTFDTFLTDELATDMAVQYEELIAQGIPIELDPQHSTKDAQRITGTKGAKGCFHFTAAHLWPYKFVLHLLNRVVENGANLQTRTPVTGISDAPDADGYWAVHTRDRGVTRARKVILATNGYTAGVSSVYNGRIIPGRGFCTHITTPPGRPAPYQPTTNSLMFSESIFDYLIPRPDGNIIVGGGKRAFVEDRKLWYDNFDDSTLIEPARPHFDDYMQRYYFGWEHSGAAVNRAWTGIMGYTSDGIPHIGAVPGKPGQFILAGYGGHGMATTFLAGRGIAQMVRDGVPYEQTGMPRLYRTSAARLGLAEEKDRENAPGQCVVS